MREIWRIIGEFKDETNSFLLYNINQYITLISHHAKGDYRKAFMKAADL